MAHWFKNSGVLDCPECEGHGSRANRPWLNTGDPDCWLVVCQECEGQGHFACDVCGFDQQISGYDCLACGTLQGLSDMDILTLDGEAFAAAFTKALAIARADVAQGAAAESTVPMGKAA
jgi:DnaJ-class molecular chaperone